MIKDFSLKNQKNFSEIDYECFDQFKKSFNLEKVFFSKQYFLKIKILVKKLFRLFQKNVFWNLKFLKETINSDRVLKEVFIFLIQSNKLEIKIYKEEFLVKLNL